MAPSKGPWVADGKTIISNGRVIMRFEDAFDEDIAFVCQARGELPRLEQEIAAAHAERDEARDALGFEQADRIRAEASVDDLEIRLALASERLRVDTRHMAQIAAVVEKTGAELDDLRVRTAYLAHAVEKYLKHRHLPKLQDAWERYTDISDRTKAP